MEAARTAALRGHQVTLAEAGSTLGGSAALAASKIDSLALIGDVLRWQRRELDRLGVDVRLASRLEPKEIVDYDAPAVIVATGSVPSARAVQSADPGREIPGTAMDHVIRAADVFTLPPQGLGTHAVVADSLGTYVAIGIAEYLVGLGVHVTFVTHFPSAGHTVVLGRRVLGSMARLHASGRFDVLPLSTILEIRADSVAVRGLGSAAGQPVPADTVVLVLGDEPETDIPAALAASDKATSVVGDAFAPRGIRAAIAHGHRAGLEV
jgi:NADPH-dependent 2,4-dienoyl-CoA reductase/sulfur reductase-like enzyme